MEKLQYSQSIKVKDMNLIVTQSHPKYAALLLDYYRRNRKYLKKWEPTRTFSFQFEAKWRTLLKERKRLHDNLLSAHWMILSEDAKQIIGCINLAHLPFVDPTLNLGYSIDYQWQRRGIMSSVLKRVMHDSFERMMVSGIEASHLPENIASAALLARLGFQQRGGVHGYRQYLVDGEEKQHICLYKENHHLNLAD